jgi:hypothetical protein
MADGEGVARRDAGQVSTPKADRQSEPLPAGGVLAPEAVPATLDLA